MPRECSRRRSPSCWAALQGSSPKGDRGRASAGADAACSACDNAVPEDVWEKLASSQSLARRLQAEKETLREQLVSAIQRSETLASQHAACSRAAAQLQMELLSARQGQTYHTSPWQSEEHASTWVQMVAGLTSVCCIQAQAINAQAWILSQTAAAPVSPEHTQPQDMNAPVSVGCATVTEEMNTKEPAVPADCFEVRREDVVCETSEGALQ